MAAEPVPFGRSVARRGAGAGRSTVLVSQEVGDLGEARFEEGAELGGDAASSMAMCMHRSQASRMPMFTGRTRADAQARMAVLGRVVLRPAQPADQEEREPVAATPARRALDRRAECRAASAGSLRPSHRRTLGELADDRLHRRAARRVPSTSTSRADFSEKTA